MTSTTRTVALAALTLSCGTALAAHAVPVHVVAMTTTLAMCPESAGQSEARVATQALVTTSTHATHTDEQDAPRAGGNRQPQIRMRSTLKNDHGEFVLKLEDNQLVEATRDGKPFPMERVLRRRDGTRTSARFMDGDGTVLAEFYFDPKPAAKAAAEVEVAVGEAEEPKIIVGVQLAPVPAALRQHLELPDGTGVLISGVGKNLPAGVAGIKPADVLVEVDGQAVKGEDEARRLIVKDRKPGQAMTLGVISNGQRRNVQVAGEAFDRAKLEKAEWARVAQDAEPAIGLADELIPGDMRRQIEILRGEDGRPVIQFDRPGVRGQMGQPEGDVIIRRFNEQQRREVPPWREMPRLDIEIDRELGPARDRLRGEIDALRREVEQLRREMNSRRRAPAAPMPPTPPRAPQAPGNDGQGQNDFVPRPQLFATTAIAPGKPVTLPRPAVSREKGSTLFTKVSDPSADRDIDLNGSGDFVMFTPAECYFVRLKDGKPTALKLNGADLPTSRFRTFPGYVEVVAESGEVLVRAHVDNQPRMGRIKLERFQGGYADGPEAPPAPKPATGGAPVPGPGATIIAPQPGPTAAGEPIYPEFPGMHSQLRLPRAPSMAKSPADADRPPTAM